MRYFTLNIVSIAAIISAVAAKSACDDYDIGIETQVEYYKVAKQRRERTIYNAKDCKVLDKLTIETEGTEGGNMCKHRDVKCENGDSGDIKKWQPQNRIVKWDCRTESIWGKGSFQVCKAGYESYVCDRNVKYFDGQVHDAETEYKQKNQETQCNTNPISDKPRIQYCCRKENLMPLPEQWTPSAA